MMNLRLKVFAALDQAYVDGGIKNDEHDVLVLPIYDAELKHQPEDVLQKHVAEWRNYRRA